MKAPRILQLAMISLGWLHFTHADEMTAADLIELDFEELVNMNVEVESAGKNKTRAIDLPYAVHVISAADIAHSGVQSVADALRLAPGVSVSQLSAGEWSVSVRGFGGRFSRFYLVMVDGRIAYNTAFSGVNWDELNITLSEIDRIEVIRGPNASAWGANAVNGIINIITRQADREAGTRIHVWAGEQGRRGQSFARNLPLEGAWHGNFYGHVSAWDGLKTAEGVLETGVLSENAHRDWRLASALKTSENDSELHIQVEAFGSEQSPYWTWLDERVPDEHLQANAEFKTGWAAQLKYEKGLSSSTKWKTRVSIDGTDRDADLLFWDSKNLQLDSEFHANWQAHAFSVGFNSRYNDSSIVSRGDFPEVIVPAQAVVKHYGVYLSDVYQAHEDLVVSVAARVDRSDLGNTNLQPSLRLLWKPRENSRIWAAVSEASAAPSRAVQNIGEVAYALIPATPDVPLPVVLVLEGHTGEDKDTELRATEVGFRQTFDKFSFDFAWFNFDYSDDVDVIPTGDPELIMRNLITPHYLRQTATFENSRSVSSDGIEASVRGQIHDRWESQLNFSRVNLEKSGDNSSEVASWINTFKLTDKLLLNLSLRHARGVANTESAFERFNTGYGEPDDYSVVDVHFKWSFSPEFSLSLIANNLGDSHGEALREEFSAPILQVEPYTLLKLSLQY